MPVECLAVSPVYIVDKRQYIAMLFQRLILVNFVFSVCTMSSSKYIFNVQIMLQTPGYLHTVIRNIRPIVHQLTVVI